MLTELKSPDYVSRVYCTPETQGAEIFPLSRPGGSGESDLGWADDAVAPLPGRRDNRCKISDRRDYRTGVDVAALIKRARLQIDRHPAWLRESGPLQRKQTCPNEATFRLQTFIGGLAHHFNNLFMVIQGNLSLMRMPGPGAKRHQPRFKRMEKLIQCESMLTNDLLGPTVDPRYRCNLALQTRVLGEVVLIAEQIHPTGQNLCVFPIPLDFDFMATFLPRLAGSVAAILESIIAELKHHCSVITADWPGPGSDLQRLQPIVAALRRGALWSAKLSEYSGTDCNLDGGTAQRKMVEIAFDRWTRSHRRVPLNLSCTKTVPRVAAAPRTLGRIFEELYDNAEFHSPADSAVSVHIRREGKGVAITVTDPGAGIEENIRDWVCLPFFSNRTTAGHCGLGLASIAGILRSLGGKISIQPAAGSGTAVTCWLPA